MPVLPFHPVIELAFDPVVDLGDWHVRLETLGIAAVMERALELAGTGTGGVHVSFDLDVCDPVIAPVVEQTCADWGIPYRVQPTLWAALRSHHRHVRELGRGDVLDRAA